MTCNATGTLSGKLVVIVIHCFSLSLYQVSAMIYQEQRHRSYMMIVISHSFPLPPPRVSNTKPVALSHHHVSATIYLKWQHHFYTMVVIRHCFSLSPLGVSDYLPGAAAPFLYDEPDHAMRNAELTDTCHVPLTTRPGREDLTWNIHPPQLLSLHALTLREHAQDLRDSSFVW